jgi:hypothetical protein
VQTAGGNARQHFALIADKTNNFNLALMAGITRDGLAAKLRAELLQAERKVLQAHALALQLRRDFYLTACRMAGLGHMGKVLQGNCCIGKA